MKVRIDDLFSLEKIADSGQCFRVRRLEEDTYRFISGRNVLYIKRVDDEYSITCDEKTWKSIWEPYFDLDTNYLKLSDEFRKADNAFINKCLNYASGVRILRQNPWEVLISFIISQNKNIPAIKASIALLSEKYGSPLETGREKLFSFPSPNALKEVSASQLRECKVGYRDKYIIDAREKVLSGEIDLEKIGTLETEKLIESLKTVNGVGEKVANCIALFAYHRLEAVPRDVWIKRSLKEDFDGVDYYKIFKSTSGVLQQHVFYTKIHQK